MPDKGVGPLSQLELDHLAKLAEETDAITAETREHLATVEARLVGLPSDGESAPGPAPKFADDTIAGIIERKLNSIQYRLGQMKKSMERF